MTDDIRAILNRPGPPGTAMLEDNSPRTETYAAVVRLLAAGVIVAALFGSGPVLSWAERLPPSDMSERLVEVCTTWDATLGKFGLARVQPWLRAGAEQVRQARFTGARN